MADNTRAEEREQEDVAPVEPAPPASPTEEELTRGREAETPFFLLGGLMVTIWTIVGLVALGLLLLWWLA